MQIAITGMGSISPLGQDREEVWRSYASNQSAIVAADLDGRRVPIARLKRPSEGALELIRAEKRAYEHLDKSVLMAIHASRQAFNHAEWSPHARIGINIGSSRGATALFEKYHSDYLAHPKHHVPALTSPTTTLGNVASWVAQDLQCQGYSMSHSITCSTALHGVINAVAWLRSGMADRFLVGGTEAPLTGFTIAQMRALRLYSDEVAADYPCRPLASGKTRNSLVLGEGASAFCLEKVDGISPATAALATIESIGFATEALRHNVSLSADGQCLQHAMQDALSGLPDTTIDAVIMHAPGTVNGDAAELVAVRRVFGDDTPFLVSNKWKIGHTFGASGALSLELALLMLRHNTVLDFPYRVPNGNRPDMVRKVMVNAVGFGGNAASLVVSGLNASDEGLARSAYKRIPGP